LLYKTSTNCSGDVISDGFTSGVAGREVVLTVRATDRSKRHRITRTVTVARQRRIQPSAPARTVELTDRVLHAANTNNKDDIDNDCGRNHVMRNIKEKYNAKNTEK